MSAATVAVNKAIAGRSQLGRRIQAPAPVPEPEPV